jgi:hypothetical protein
MQNLRNLWAGFLAALGLPAALALGALTPTVAVAQVTTPKVTIICGSACQARRQVDQMEQWSDLESYMRGLYSSRRSWNDFTDDPTVFYTGWSWDLRCNGSARVVAGGTTASSAPSQQKSAAEAVFSTIRTSMGGASSATFTNWVGTLATSAGTYAVSGASFPSSTKIVSIAWQDGTGSNFSVTQSASGWGIGQLISTIPKPAGETTACPS